jgi:NADH-quinone oxidoreductase subunit M
MWFHEHILTTVLFLPLAGAALMLFFPAGSKTLIRVWANLVGFAGFLVSLPLAFWFNSDDGGYQFVERADWIPSIGASYALGMDGISLLLVLLTTILGFISILSS